MKHFPPSLYIKSAGWARNPPTGSTLARELDAVLTSQEYVEELARLSGRTEDYVRWQLRLDSVVPACLLTAALRLRQLRVVPPYDHGERHLSVPGEHGCRWVFTLRDDPSADPPARQFDVRLQDDRRWVSLFAGDSDRAMFLFYGPLERYHLAIAARDRALAAWCAGR